MYEEGLQCQNERVEEKDAAIQQQKEKEEKKTEEEKEAGTSPREA